MTHCALQAALIRRELIRPSVVSNIVMLVKKCQVGLEAVTARQLRGPPLPLEDHSSS